MTNEWKLHEKGKRKKKIGFLTISYLVKLL